MLNDAMKRRYTAFWAHEAIDRCLIYIDVNQSEEIACGRMFGYDEQQLRQGKPEMVQGALERQWEDLDWRVQSETENVAHTRYFGDGFPSVFTNFGPGSLAACIGGNYQLAPTTIWFDRNPVIDDWDDLPTIEFDPVSKMNRLTEGLTQKLCEAGQGRFYTSVADLGGTLDVIASLRGSQELLYDLYDYPEQMLSLICRVGPMWKESYRRLTDIIFRYYDGMTSWMPIWCKDRYAPIQCDFSAMLSPEMFEEFVLPDLVDLTEFLDKSIYHLDGPGELPHLDYLLQMPRLDAIQWVPGSGNYDVTDACWFEMYQKIQAAGKNLILFTDEPEQIENLLRHVSTKGLFIWAMNMTDEKLAQELVKIADSYGVK